MTVSLPQVFILEDYSTMREALARALEAVLSDKATIHQFDTPWELQAALPSTGVAEPVIIVTDLYLDKYPTRANPNYTRDAQFFRSDTPEGMLEIVKRYVEEYLQSFVRQGHFVIVHTRMRRFLESRPSGPRFDLSKELTEVLKAHTVAEECIIDKSQTDATDTENLAPVVSAVTFALGVH